MSSSGPSSATPAVAEITAVAPPRPQYAALIAVLALAAPALAWLMGDGWRMRVLLLLGMALGAVLYQTAFGFTTHYREFMLRRDTRGLRAQILMLALATLLFAPVLAAGSAFGYSMSGAVAPLGVQVVAGAFLFGLGMQLAGGCGSGALYTAGGGSARMLIVLFFFIAGSFWASLHMSWWERLPSHGEAVLGDLIGWTGAVALQLGVLAAIWLSLRRLAPSRPGRSSQPDGVPAGKHALLIGAILLAVLAFLVLLVAGHPWSITWAFALWGAKAALRLGWQPEESAFWNGDFQHRALESSIFEDVTSVTDIGIILGALAAAGVGGKFRPRISLSAASLAAAVIGGVAMGYGARIAYGCNIGAFFSGVASTSLHGWVWIVAALGGTAIGVRLRPWFGLRN